jgi:hypothetical protein
MVGEMAQTFIDFPSMQKSASFDADAVNEQMQKKLEAMAAR